MKKIWYAIAFAVLEIVLCGFNKQAPEAPVVRPFGDNAEWITIEDMEYRIGTTNEKIVVPKGFVTDFASIPKPLWSFGLSPHGQYGRAAVIHDFLYWTQGCSRVQSDRLLLIAMKESKVGSFDELAIFAGVSAGGESAWANNAKERSAHLPRIVPEKFLRPGDPNMNWKDYRKMLVAKGVRDPQFEANPSYCKFGNSTDVPSGDSAASKAR
ncbi:DUF1353 domain-containing protein [Parasulfuritortus cantonensis]|uniref:DUF1353 domain-containing protein n=1 Tax=Parasulfuritortus cantonensis TaxID=2528202 RepID=A0A4R1BDV4_9PROT|nr:DUF1353 domain-containing protein [Parasulfuritortus cantonensis]TCJ15227.1 DUF1353 domain-containing protein [Parasulfuritortus cantonensis]